MTSDLVERILYEAFCVVAALALVRLLAGCATLGPAPTFEGTWQARHASQSIVRKQEGREVRCSDPEFDNYLCMKPETALYIKNSCKKGALE